MTSKPKFETVEAYMETLPKEAQGVLKRSRRPSNRRYLKPKEVEVSKTTVKFPMNQPIPYALVRQLAKYRAMKNEEKAKKKKR